MKQLRKIAVFLALGITFGTGIYLLTAKLSSTSQSNGKLNITTSFYPMGEFARQIGGDKVNVTVLVKPGVEPHDFDPTPGDIAAIHHSKVLIYNGAGLEAWADKLKPELKREGIVVVAASDGIALQNIDASQAQSGDTSTYDPHVWLDPVLASKEVALVKTALIAADPLNRASYERGAAAYQQQLAALDASYTSGLRVCTNHQIITAHQAFKYLAARYHFEALGIAGLSPDEEPSPAKLAQVAQFARSNNVKYIFFETLASPKLADTIAREVGAQTLVFNPLEGLTDAQLSGGQNYVSVQRENLENLRIALNCK
jgi:zinc transport system substrate-binding protein